MLLNLDNIVHILWEYERATGHDTICEVATLSDIIKKLVNIPEKTDMVKPESWKQFRETGLLWWINTLLHTFGYAIVTEVDDNEEVVNAYPARVKFRGFGEKQVEAGYQKVSKYLKENIEELEREARE
jgi:hypothetical protein